MFSLGWPELALTALIVIIVVGPKEIPNLLKQIGTFTKSIKKISREFKSSLNEIANEADLKDVKESLSSINEIKKDIDPTNQIKKQIDSIKKTANVFENEINDLNNSDNLSNSEKNQKK
tara:strand:+ start:513 stop:869 length:357 start_codon:yes stop_codon:yes gene_type:complete